MVNKRLTIENLENLEELTTEEVSSIHGGLSLEESSSENNRIYVDPDRPYPLPPKPYHCRPYPLKNSKDKSYSRLPWCAVIL